MIGGDRIRIGYVYRNFNRRGSIPSVYVDRVEHLAELEDVTAICSATTRAETTAPVRFETVEPLVRGDGRVSYAVECASFAFRATRFLRSARSRFDVVHVEGFAATEADIVTVHAVRPAELEHYFTAVEPDARRRRRLAPVLRPQSGVVMAVERRLFRPPYPICLALTNAIAADLRRFYGVPEELIQVQPYGIDLGLFRFDADARASVRARLRVDEEQLVALFVGDELERKGLRTAIEGVARARPGVELWVAGRGDPEPYGAALDDLGVRDRVRFLGRLERAELAATYSAADFVLLPSRQDAWGHPVIEGMAASRVPIVSENAGSHEVIEPGTNGFVLSGSGSGAEIAAVLDGPVRNPDARARIGERALASAAPFDADALWGSFHEAHRWAHERRRARLAAGG